MNNKITAAGIYNFTKTIGKILFSFLSSFLVAVFFDTVESHKSLKSAFNALTNFNKITTPVFWLALLLLLSFALINSVTNLIRIRQKPSKEFIKLMRDHTCETLKDIPEDCYSWGYNANIYKPKDYLGDKPKHFIITDYVENASYRFPTNSDKLPGYNKAEFKQYCQSDLIKSIEARGDNRERFSVKKISINKSSVTMKMQKTKWDALKFSWNYLKLIDDNANPVNRHSLELQDKVETIHKAVFQQNNDDYMINSFCLHLILESKEGNVILSQISPKKQGDYPSTWAATIGEQIEEKDFYSNHGDYHYDFIKRWVIRALDEEYDIRQEDWAEYGSELDEYVDMNSLKILSIDFEGDIYNIAVTAVLKLKISVDKFKTEKGILIDRLENIDLKEISLEDIREILLDYPDNQTKYHPSTYLRLLMFHLYKCGVKNTCEEFCTQNQIKKFLLEDV